MNKVPEEAREEAMLGKCIQGEGAEGLCRASTGKGGRCSAGGEGGRGAGGEETEATGLVVLGRLDVTLPHWASESSAEGRMRPPLIDYRSVVRRPGWLSPYLCLRSHELTSRYRPAGLSWGSSGGNPFPSSSRLLAEPSSLWL